MRYEVPEHELRVRATRAGGPGGQHVNKAATRVEVVWDVAGSSTLSAARRARLLERLASRLDAAGRLRVVADDTRSQARNRTLAVARLRELVRRALIVPRPRKATAPPPSAVARRLDHKRRRGKRKRERRPPPDDD